MQSWIIGKPGIVVGERTRISHVSHRRYEKGCAKLVRCVKSVAKDCKGNGLEKACDPQWTWLPQLPQEEHEGGVGGFWVVRSLGGMKARGVPV